MASKSISIGVLLHPVQALDIVGPLDVLSTVSHEALSGYGPPGLADRLNPPRIQFHYIGPTKEPALLTANIRMVPNCTIADCPKLDVLLIGGPMPDYAKNLPQDINEFLLAKSKEVSIILTTCTGALVLAATGVLDGLEATVNHMAIDMKLASGIAPRTKWDRTRYWVVAEKDGTKIWTAAGAGAGMDMTAQWVRESFEHGPELIDFATQGLEWQPRDVKGKPMKYVNGRGETVEA